MIMLPPPLGLLLPFALLCSSAIVTSTSATSPGDAKSNRLPGPRYDPDSVISVSGVVVDVREQAEPVALQGVHVMLRSERHPVHVFIAPAGFMKAFGFRLAKGDDLQVSGSKVRFDGADLILARQLRKDSEILVLRNDDGAPYWEDDAFKNCCISSKSVR